MDDYGKDCKVKTLATLESTRVDSMSSGEPEFIHNIEDFGIEVGGGKVGKLYRNVNATKSDKAPVPVKIWAYHRGKITGVHLDLSWEGKTASLRNLIVQVWRRSSTSQDLIKHLLTRDSVEPG